MNFCSYYICSLFFCSLSTFLCYSKSRAIFPISMRFLLNKSFLLLTGLSVYEHNTFCNFHRNYREREPKLSGPVQVVIIKEHTQSLCEVLALSSHILGRSLSFPWLFKYWNILLDSSKYHSDQDISLTFSVSVMCEIDYYIMIKKITCDLIRHNRGTEGGLKTIRRNITCLKTNNKLLKHIAFM